MSLGPVAKMQCFLTNSWSTAFFSIMVRAM
jgi:hypothetical protein